MTLQEANEQIAKKYGHESWHKMAMSLHESCPLVSYQHIIIRSKEAAELYAQSAREQAIDDLKPILLEFKEYLDSLEGYAPFPLNEEKVDNFLLNLKEKK